MSIVILYYYTIMYDDVCHVCMYIMYIIIMNYVVRSSGSEVRSRSVDN
jgi:hypothetical protein